MAPIDYEILPGRSRENAKAAIAKAEENGFTGADVQTFRGGYRIPVEVDESEVSEEESKDADTGTEVPDFDGMKVDELDAFIDSHEDLGVDKSLNKSEKIAALKAATEKKGD